MLNLPINIIEHPGTKIVAPVVQKNIYKRTRGWKQSKNCRFEKTRTWVVEPVGNSEQFAKQIQLLNNQCMLLQSIWSNMFTPQVYRYKQRWSKPKLMTHLNNGAKKGERGVFAISAQQAAGQCEKSANQNSAKYKNTSKERFAKYRATIRQRFWRSLHQNLPIWQVCLWLSWSRPRKARPLVHCFELALNARHSRLHWLQ